jgi:GTP pyrophosphokinase
MGPSRNHHFSKSKPTINWRLRYHIQSKNKIRNVLNENTKKIAEDGKEILIRKLKHLK